MHLRPNNLKAVLSKWQTAMALVLALGGAVGDAQPAANNPRQTLPGHMLPVVKKLQPFVRLPGSAQLHLTIGLPLRDPAGLTNLLQQIYDPASSNYRHFLTSEEFTQRFGPSEQDYASVIAFAESNGLTVSTRHSNRMLVEVDGRISDIEKAFGVRMNMYHHPTENRDFFATDIAPSIPSGLKVQDIWGLNSYARPYPKYRRGLGRHGPAPKIGTGPYGNYLGYDFRAAYAPSVALTGTGQSVALVQFDGYLASDIKAYETLAGLPNVPLKNVLLNGFNGKPTGNGGEVEVSLDIEMVISMAPGLTNVTLYMGSPSNFNPNSVLSRIASDNSARQVSCSWGWNGGPNSTTEQIFLQMAAQGQSFFNASGDSDAFQTGEVDDPGFTGTPSASPNITQVGGTILETTGPGGSWSSETVWNVADGVGSSGGISTFYSIPVWQQGINMTANKGSTTHRNIPDVALTADNVLVIADNGTLYPGTGGTSCAAPLWAGFTALVNQQAAGAGVPPVGFLNPTIYSLAKSPSYGSYFHDITTGDNTWSGSPNLFPAVAGYDLCTGWGTPVGQNLINAFVAGGTVDGIMELGFTPPDGSILLGGTTQSIFVQVTDVLSVTNATVVATVNGTTNLTFLNNGAAPDAKANDAIYSANLDVPNGTNLVVLNFLITAPAKTNSTNVVTYNVVPTPANDYFTNATKVPPGGGVFLANNKFATLEKGEPVHAGDTNVAASLWWNWSPTTSTNVFIDTTGSEIDTVVGVYSGPNVSNLTLVSATNDVGAAHQAYLNFNAIGGATYRIAVASANSNSLGAIRFAVVPGGYVDTNPPTVAVTSPLSGQWVSNFLVTFVGTATDPLPNATGIKRVLLTANGRTYEVTGTTNWTYSFGLSVGLNRIGVTAVDVAGNNSEQVVTEVTYMPADPPNDLFANAIPLSGNSGTVSVTTTNATKEFDEPNHAGNAGGKSVWWSFTPSADGALSLTTSNSTFDTLLGLYTGTSVSELTTIASNDDAYPGAPGGFSALTQAVRSNQTYYIAVDGYGGASGVAYLGYAFTPAIVFGLTTSSTGHGQAAPPSGDVVSGSTATLTATPDQFYAFGSWSGSFSSMANPLSLVVNSNVSLTANFLPIVFTDDFETGNFSKIGWTSSGDAPWTVQSSNVLAGNYSAQSGAIGNSQSSSLILTTNFFDGTATFYFKVSSEPDFDVFSFFVDGVQQQQGSGEIDWTSFSFPLAAGTHTLEWRYTKDATFSDGLDAAFIDNVLLPISMPVDSSTAAHLQIACQADGSMLITVHGQTNRQYVIQGSTAPGQSGPWQNLYTNTAANGIVLFIDPPSGSNHVRYYRAIAP
jgi:hypothetical protein